MLGVFKQRIRTGDEQITPLWLTVLNSLFYVLVVVAVAAFLYYLNTFQVSKDTDRQGKLILYFPILLEGAGVTIVISIVSMVLATIFGFVGALGRLSRL